MTEIKPQFLDEESYAAKFDRQFSRDILTEGVVATGDLEITELDTPGMGVKAASGAGYVQGDQAATQGHYRIFNDASKNLTIAASDPTNPRKDRIIAQVYDSIDIGGVDDEWVLEVLTGTPAASPDPPALPDDALDLAIVLVGNGVTEILNADITDWRKRIGLQNVSEKGWEAAGEPWTYASANTFTISGDKTGKYQKGDKIKLTQTTVKYFYIIGVSYSSPNTTITITGGTDYALVNATITDNYYSKILNPQGFPTWFNFTFDGKDKVDNGAGGMPTFRECKFAIFGRICQVTFSFNVAYKEGAGQYYGVIETATNYLPVISELNNPRQPLGAAKGDGQVGFFYHSAYWYIMVENGIPDDTSLSTDGGTFSYTMS